MFTLVISFHSCSGLVEVKHWTPEEVGTWLEGLSLGEYRENFIRNDIRGSELIVLERRDLKVSLFVFFSLYSGSILRKDLVSLRSPIWPCPAGRKVLKTIL